jgi:secreted trypsin-like serine protease
MAGIVSTVCGKTRFHGKIFGGQKAEPERWPWQASLLLRGSHICGAALIDKAWVLSAAHCFQRCVFQGQLLGGATGERHKVG